MAGRMHAPTLEDREHPPCTNTVLHEIQRFISMVPFGLPRALTCNTTSCPRCPLSLGILHRNGEGLSAGLSVHC